MASNKYFTIMIVPEKTQQVKKVVIPSYIFKTAILAVVFLVILAAIMVLDYANVMNQISEHRQLKVENRQLKQSVQTFKDKLITIESTMDRVKTFATKLKIILDIPDPAPEAGAVPQQMPVAIPPISSPTLPKTPDPVLPAPPAETKKSSGLSPAERGEVERALASLPNAGAGEDTDVDVESDAPLPGISMEEATRVRRKTLLAALVTPISEATVLSDADSSLWVKAEFQRLDAAYEEVQKFALAEEQEIQYIFEKSSDRRALIASTPTILPTSGYISSEFGPRKSPYDGRMKMHEGIDIATKTGALIRSPADGMVLKAESKPGYGRVVVIDHGNGIETIYAHTKAFLVQAGERVRRNQAIALVGSTGHSTGPHCHYEVRVEGTAVDPCWYILEVYEANGTQRICKKDRTYSTSY